MRYIIVTTTSLPKSTDSEDADSEDIDATTLDILSHDGQPLLFDLRTDAEDFMDVADIDVEMVVIEAPASLTGGIIVA